MFLCVVPSLAPPSDSKVPRPAGLVLCKKHAKGFHTSHGLNSSKVGCIRYGGLFKGFSGGILGV